MTGGSLGTWNLRVTATGVRGSLDDGSLHVRGARRQPVMASISSPRGALPALKASRDACSRMPAARPISGRSATPSRCAWPTAPPSASAVPASARCRSRSATGLAAPRGCRALGQREPGARVLVAHDQGAADRSAGGHRSRLRRLGGHAARPARGDRVVVSAGDAATHGVTTLSLIVGGLVPRIEGLVDQQPVRAGAAASVTGLPSGASVLWGGDLPETLGGTSLTLPVDRMPDGPARVTATATGRPELDRLPLRHRRLDSADGRRRARPDRARRAPRGVRDAGADANGLAAVRFRFTAKGNGVGQPVNQLGQPFRHVFTKLGIYAVTVTITDLAGNTTTDRAIVRVVAAWPRRSAAAGPLARRGAPASARSSARASRATSRSRSYAPTAASPSPARSRSTRRAWARSSRSRSSAAPGRYLAVRQFVDANGVAGPVVATPLFIA